MCPTHTRAFFGVEIGDTAHGKGLFATRPIAAHTNICPYFGEPISAAELQRRYGDLTAPYVVKDTRRCGVDPFIDAAFVRSIGSLANTATPGTDMANNSAIAAFPDGEQRRSMPTELSRHYFWLRATSDIPAGREILVSYGAGGYRFDDAVHFTVEDTARPLSHRERMNNRRLAYEDRRRCGQTASSRRRRRSNSLAVQETRAANNAPSTLPNPVSHNHARRAASVETGGGQNDGLGGPPAAAPHG
jgi:hypothetical protein